MLILLARTIEFVHSEQVSALFTFCLGQVLLYNFLGMTKMYLLYVILRRVVVKDLFHYKSRR
jgi:hypothetical protein